MITNTINVEALFGDVSRGSGGFARSGSVQFSADNALTIFEQLLVYKEDILANEIGAYALAERVTAGKAYWASFDDLKWISKARPANCDRTAITDHGMTEVSKTLCKNHIFLEFCKDSVVAELDTLWSSLWGAGNDLNEILATEGGRAIFQKFVNRVIGAIGNDFYNIAWWGNHPIIGTANTANLKSYSAGIQTRITNTYGVCDGLLKQIDVLKTGSYPHINNDISGGDFNGYEYTGDAIALIDNLDVKAHSDLDEALDGLREMHEYPIVFVTKGIFNRLTEQITATYPGLASSLCYNMNGTLADEVGVELKNKTTYNAFVWKGKLIVKRPDWDSTAKSLGFYHHRALMFVPKSLGIAIDVDVMTQFGGMGLAIVKSGDPKDGGAYFLESNYQIATAILKDTYLVNYSYYGMPA